jgi:hypothetical protein
LVEGDHLFETTAALRNGDDRPSRILLSDVTPASPIHPLTNGCRFQCWNRNRNPARPWLPFCLLDLVKLGRFVDRATVGGFRQLEKEQGRGRIFRAD